MPDDKQSTGRAHSDDRGEAIDKAAAPRSESRASAGKTDDGKGQSDTGRADQTDDKAEASDEAAGKAFDPDAEQA
jgi:hypothetical protein